MAATEPTSNSMFAPATDGPASPLYIDTQHDDMVHDAQLDYYGCKLATSSSDRTIKIYNVSDNAYEHTMTLEGHEGPVWQVSWAHPKFGVLLASCSFDGSVLIHREVRPRDWTLIYSNKSLHESSVNGLAFAPHELGLILAAASSDGNVSILSHQPDNSWSVEYIHDNALGVNAVSWAATGAYSDSAHPRLVTGGCDNRIRFWIKNSENNQWEEDKTGPIGSELSHTDWVRDVAWAPPLLPDVNVVASCSEDRKVIIWTQSGGSGNDWKPALLYEFDAPVWRVSWSLTAQMLAVSSGDNHVTLWKAGIDGNWSQMGTIEDAASNGKQ